MQKRNNKNVTTNCDIIVPRGLERDKNWALEDMGTKWHLPKWEVNIISKIKKGRDWVLAYYSETWRSIPDQMFVPNSVSEFSLSLLTDPGHPSKFPLSPAGRLMVRVLITIPKEVYRRLGRTEARACPGVRWELGNLSLLFGLHVSLSVVGRHLSCLVYFLAYWHPWYTIWNLLPASCWESRHWAGPLLLRKSLSALTWSPKLLRRWIKEVPSLLFIAISWGAQSYYSHIFHLTLDLDHFNLRGANRVSRISFFSVTSVWPIAPYLIEILWMLWNVVGTIPWFPNKWVRGILFLFL